MRSLAFTALLGLLLAGCAGDDHSHDETTTDMPTTTTTTRAPNVPPVIDVKMADADGNATNVILAGSTLTFDASGSSDPDGDGMAAMAIVAVQGNTTFEAQILFDAGTYRNVTYTFDSAGPVNVTVSAVDMRGGLTTANMMAYVNAQYTLGSDKTFTGMLPAQVADADTCKAPSGQATPTAADALVWAKHTFAVANGTTFIEAALESGTAEYALCAPDGTAITGESAGATTSNDGTVFTAGEYFVNIVSGAANAKAPVVVTVHYEPKA